LELPSVGFGSDEKRFIDAGYGYWWWRILKPGGIFLTQQVGLRNCVQLNQYLEAPLELDVSQWKLDQEIEELNRAGFTILQSYEQVL